MERSSLLLTCRGFLIGGWDFPDRLKGAGRPISGLKDRFKKNAAFAKGAMKIAVAIGEKPAASCTRRTLTLLSQKRKPSPCCLSTQTCGKLSPFGLAHWC